MGVFFNWLFRHLKSAQGQLMVQVDKAIPEAPEPVRTACESLSGVTSSLGAFSQFVPWTSVGIAAAVLVSGLLAAFAVKVVRIVLSFVTLGGGAAG